MVISDWQGRVIQALNEKMKKAVQLYQNLVKNVNSVRTETKKDETNNITLPSFI